MSNYVHVLVSNKWKTVPFVKASTVVRLVPECAHWFGMRVYFFFYQGHLTQSFHTIKVEIIDKHNLAFYIVELKPILFLVKDLRID